MENRVLLLTAQFGIRLPAAPVFASESGEGPLQQGLSHVPLLVLVLEVCSGELLFLQDPEENFRLGHDSSSPPSLCESCSTGNEFHAFFPKLPLLPLLLPLFLLPLSSL